MDLSKTTGPGKPATTGRRSGLPAVDNQWTVMLSPSDGSAPRDITPGMPLHGAPFSVWPDDQGGLVMAGETTFDDQQAHATV